MVPPWEWVNPDRAIPSQSPAAGEREESTHQEKSRVACPPYKGSFCLCNQPPKEPGAYSDYKSGRGEIVNFGFEGGKLNWRGRSLCRGLCIPQALEGWEPLHWEQPPRGILCLTPPHLQINRAGPLKELYSFFLQSPAQPSTLKQSAV